MVAMKEKRSNPIRRPGRLEKEVNVLLDDATEAGSREGQRSQFGVIPVPQISDKDDPMANPKDKYDEDVKFLKNHFAASKIGTNKMKSVENWLVSWAIVVSKLQGGGYELRKQF